MGWTCGPAVRRRWPSRRIIVAVSRSTARVVANDQHAAGHTPQPIPNMPGPIAQRRTRALQRAGEDAHPVSQQGTVGRIVHIRFYDRGVDPKATTVRDPGTLRDVDDLPMQLRDDGG